jgi:quinol-cytochrome oxidoreductase complex cytochrome b subunit
MERLGAFLRDRTGWDAVRASLSALRAPERGFVFYLGGITLFLLLLQVASGVLLLVHYRPDAAEAHASVQRIVGQIPYGDLIRGVHVWAGDLFVLCLALHLFVIVVRRSYVPPHELTWLSGHAALVLGIGLAFTGAILPWSEQAYTQARLGSEIARYVPLVGDGLQRFMRGGDEVSPSTLVHAFGFHVAVLPAALTLLVAGHLFFVTRKPVIPPGRAVVPTFPFYPDFIVKQAVAWTLVLVLVMTLAIFADRPVGIPADPRLPSLGARPPWYFLPAHQIIRVSPRELLGVDGARFLVGAACGLGLVAVALPFLDRTGSKVTTWVAWIALLVLLVLSTSALL